MTSQKPAQSATTEGLTLSPTLDLVTEAAQVPPQYSTIDHRVLALCGIAMLIGVGASFMAQMLIKLIAIVTNLAYYGTFSLSFRSPTAAVLALGIWSIPIPIIGALVVGLMARYGSKAIRGHGFPEAMAQILTNESKIAPRVTLLKPVSAAVAIGTGGPFGAEGPIIASGGALGSLVGQLIRTTAEERKTLLAAGAAAGMAAAFGSPVSAVLLAIELLLFEFRPRSIIPVALASATATGIRMVFEGMDPVFPMSNLVLPTGTALTAYILLGGLMGLISVVVTKTVYAIEDGFDKLPIHWMWWPALGAIPVGVIGYYVPDTLGVGYQNIDGLLSNGLAVSAIAILGVMKFISWAFSLGSGTSGGTLAPLFTIGGCMGALVGIGIDHVAPGLGIDPRIAALVGMASLFSGAARAMLASAVFAFEATLQPLGLLPLLGGCAASYLISSLFMRNSLMTEKIARRGIRTPDEYVADILDRVLVSEIAATGVISVKADDTVGQVREWLQQGSPEASHQAFPVLNQKNVLVGLITRRDLAKADVTNDQKIADAMHCPVRFVYDDCTVRQAADHMANHSIGRLPVVSRQKPHRLVGIITRSNVIAVFQRRIRDTQFKPTVAVPVRPTPREPDRRTPVETSSV